MLDSRIVQKVEPRKSVAGISRYEVWDKIKTAICGPKHITLTEWKYGLEALGIEKKIKKSA